MIVPSGAGDRLESVHDCNIRHSVRTPPVELFVSSRYLNCNCGWDVVCPSVGGGSVVWQIGWAVALHFQFWSVVINKRVIGLDYDFLTLQWLSNVFGTIFTVGLYADSTLADGYYARYDDRMELRDVVFMIHNLVITSLLLMLPLCRRYERSESQTVTWFSSTIGIVRHSSSLAACHSLNHSLTY